MAGSHGSKAWWVALATLALVRCSGGGGCSCLQPLTGPFPDANKVNRMVQARVTPQGFTFVSQKLPQIVGSLVPTACAGSTGVPCATGYTCACPAGQTCGSCPSNNLLCTLSNPRMCTANPPPTQPTIGLRVPPVSQNFSDGDPRTRVCTSSVGLTWNNCRIYTRLRSTTLTPTNSTDMALAVNLDITVPGRPNGIKLFADTGQNFWEPSARCTLYPNISNRQATATVRLGRDTRSDRITINVLNLDIPFSGSDISIEAESGDDTITCFLADLGFIKNIIVDQLKPQLQATLEDAIVGALDPLTTQTCVQGMSGYQCPRLTDGTMSVCGSGGLCRYPGSGGAPIPALLGMEGRLDVGSILPDFLSVSTAVDFTTYAGGNAPAFASGGLNISMVGGANTTANACVPPRTPDTSTVPTYSFPTTIAPANGGTAASYHAGVVASDRMLEEILGEAYSGGLLCQELGTTQVGLINSGLIGLVLGEGTTLAEIMGESAPPRPVIIELKPKASPQAQVGLGTSGPDPADPTRTILPEPLLTLYVPELDMDIYTLVDDRYMRIITLTVDLTVGLGLELTAQNQMHLVVNPVDTWVSNIRASNAEVLGQDTTAIEQAVPELLGAFLPQFAPNLDQTFDLPALQGFELQNVRLRGVQTRSGQTVFGHTRYRFLGIFSDLNFNPANVQPLTVHAQTVVELREMELPDPRMMSATLGSARQRVRAVLDMQSTFVTQPDAQLEHSYRIDHGFWHPYHADNTLVISDVELNLQGWHTVEVRSRVVGAPETLDESPAEITLLSDVEKPTVSLHRSGQELSVDVWDRVSPPERLLVRVRAKDAAWVDLPGGAHRAMAVDALLDARAFLEVEVEDEAGHVGRASVGDRSWEPATASTVARRAPSATPASAGETPQSDSCGGCDAGGVSGLALWGLAAVLFRRRRRHHP